MPTTAQPTDAAVNSGFDQDWTNAQQHYAAAITAGYSADDADALYLNPVKQKYDILKGVSPAMQKKAAGELDQAQANLFRNFNAGYTLDDAQKMTLNPVVDKWQAAASIKEPAKPDPLLDEKMGALQEVAAGYDPQQVLQGHPRQIFADPSFVEKFETTADRGTRDRRSREAKTATTAAKATAEKSFNDNATEYSKLTSLFQSPRFAAAPPPVQEAVKSRIGQLEGNLTSSPLIKPPDDIGMGAPTSPAGAKYLTKFRTAADVKAAFRSKELNQDEATKILQDQFGYQ